MRYLISLIQVFLFSSCFMQSANGAEFTLFNNRLFMPAQINGHQTQALLDSGAEMSLIDTRYALANSLTPEGEAVARGTGGQQAVQFVSGAEIKVDQAYLDNQTLIALDLTDISERLIGRPLTLVVGRSLFDRGPVWIDFTTNELQLVSPLDKSGDQWSKRLKHAEKLPLREHKGIKQIPVFLEGKKVWADFDLGNGSGAMISRKLATELGLLSPERITGTKRGGGIGGEVTRQTILIKELKIGGKSFSDLTIAVDDTDDSSSMNVGTHLLKHFSLLVDFPSDSLYLSQQ
ncbi:retropepsin-like aspartic protease [Microbulbifer marinus]|uniref:Aspartyl protease n=1 Tax=Microbulbifer marinus TaxID=658218 RepID=A0A1H3YV65_9GAMM|nr:retropepsin-like aspartic protease [Microbulbifer marinus]SEA15287.1 Aspartyl protease [Microbulbifer marinus]